MWEGRNVLRSYPDEPYFFSSATPVTMAQYYASIYPAFEMAQFYEWLDKFGLEKTRRIATFSKGMKKQLIMLLSICTYTKYLICDETFDGLDPVMRQSVKSMIASQMEERGLTCVIASHNLRELEDICDHVGLLHRGGVLLSKDLQDMKWQYPEGTVCVSDRDRCSDRYAESGYCTEGKERLFVYAYDPREKSRDHSTFFTGWYSLF